jgi:molecular chaperone GrpE (heat shock protein)
MKVEEGAAFDPTYHEAVEVRFADVEEPTVAGVVVPGYLYENELLRPARVVVVK